MEKTHIDASSFRMLQEVIRPVDFMVSGPFFINPLL